MKKRALCAVAAAVAVAGGVAPMAFAASGGVKGPEPKVTFCHHTSSATNPYVVITTGNVALVRAHMKNHDDVLAEDGVCPTGGGGGGGGGFEL
jgi:ABC-type sugar transport system substrate-binding protein